MSAATILLIDPYDELLECYAEILSMGGYRVIKASDGEQGVALFSAYQGKIDLVITDVEAGMESPCQAMHAIRAFDAQVPVLFLSTLTEREAIRRIGEFNHYYLLSKLLTPEDMRCRIDTIIRNEQKSPIDKIVA